VRTCGRLILLLLFFFISTVSNGAGKATIPIPAHEAPSFADDSPYDSLKLTLRINLAYLNGLPPDRSVLIAGQDIPLPRLVRSLRLFQEILGNNPSPAELDRLVRERFDIFQAAGTKGNGAQRNMLVTGYYQPVFEGSLTREAPFLHPLYALPDDLVLNRGSHVNAPAYGRLEEGRLIPYWSREEIEKENRAAGHELVWLRDPFDAFLVHIQGSAIIRLQDGSRRGIHFAAKNGHPYQSIGGYLVRTGRLARHEVNMRTIRAYLAAHPKERDEIFHANPSFIFFAWTDTTNVTGSLGTELIAGRSVAADQRCFPAGVLGFLVSRRPTVTAEGEVIWAPLHRFVMVQDSGSAIKGSGRVDLFWGSGAQAGEEAGLMKEQGALFFLLAKEEEATRPSGQPSVLDKKGS